MQRGVDVRLKFALHSRPHVHRTVHGAATSCVRSVPSCRAREHALTVVTAGHRHGAPRADVGVKSCRNIEQYSIFITAAVFHPLLSALKAVALKNSTAPNSRNLLAFLRLACPSVHINPLPTFRLGRCLGGGDERGLIIQSSCDIPASVVPAALTSNLSTYIYSCDPFLIP